MATLMPLYDTQNYRNEEARRTLTRQAILWLRSTACNCYLNHPTRTGICLHDPRAWLCRDGGQLTVKSKVTQCLPISTVTGNWRTRRHTVLPSSNNEQRRSCIHDIDIKLMPIPVVTGLRLRPSVSRSAACCPLHHRPRAPSSR